MEEHRQTKITIDGKDYASLEEVPENIRALIKSQLEAANIATEDIAGKIAPQPGDPMVSKKVITIKKNFMFKVSSNMTETPQENQPQPAWDSPRAEFPVPPKSIEPASSKRFLLIMVVIAAAIYLLYFKR